MKIDIKKIKAELRQKEQREQAQEKLAEALEGLGNWMHEHFGMLFTGMLEESDSVEVRQAQEGRVFLEIEDRGRVLEVTIDFTPDGTYMSMSRLTFDKLQQTYALGYAAPPLTAMAHAIAQLDQYGLLSSENFTYGVKYSSDDTLSFTICAQDIVDDPALRAAWRIIKEEAYRG